MIDRQFFSDQTVTYNLKTYGSIWKFATNQKAEYPSGSLLGYSYFKNCYKIIAIDLSK